jgi:hypothetical protein
MEYETILQVGSNRMLPRYAYHKPFTVTFPDKCELMLGCTDGAQEADTASVWGSTPQYSRLKYIPLILV